MSEEVKSYYENNSSLFDLVGIDPHEKNIHQPLWGNDVKTSREASNYSNSLVKDAICQYVFSERTGKSSILDLGCGFGASLAYLAKELPDRDLLSFSGITISDYQTKISRQRLGEIGEIICGDFHELSSFFDDIQVIYAIESMVHSSSLVKLLEEVKQSLAPGGLFVIIDDFLVREEAHQVIDDYRDNWFTHGVTTESEFLKMCQSMRLTKVTSRSLTPLIRQSFKGILGRLLYFFGFKVSNSLYLKSIIGGAARQNALLSNHLDYRLLILKNDAS